MKPAVTVLKYSNPHNNSFKTDQQKPTGKNPEYFHNNKAKGSSVNPLKKKPTENVANLTNDELLKDISKLNSNSNEGKDAIVSRIEVSFDRLERAMDEAVNRRSAFSDVIENFNVLIQCLSKNVDWLEEENGSHHEAYAAIVTKVFCKFAYLLDVWKTGFRGESLPHQELELNECAFQLFLCSYLTLTKSLKLDSKNNIKYLNDQKSLAAGLILSNKCQKVIECMYNDIKNNSGPTIEYGLDLALLHYIKKHMLPNPYHYSYTPESGQFA